MTDWRAGSLSGLCVALSPCLLWLGSWLLVWCSPQYRHIVSSSALLPHTIHIDFTLSNWDKTPNHFFSLRAHRTEKSTPFHIVTVGNEYVPLELVKKAKTQQWNARRSRAFEPLPLIARPETTITKFTEVLASEPVSQIFPENYE
jgi:hypothetical protein